MENNTSVIDSAVFGNGILSLQANETDKFNVWFFELFCTTKNNLIVISRTYSFVVESSLVYLHIYNEHIH